MRSTLNSFNRAINAKEQGRELEKTKECRRKIKDKREEAKKKKKKGI